MVERGVNLERRYHRSSHLSVLRSKLNSSQEFDLTASVGALCNAEGCALNVGGWVGVAIGDGRQLQLVEGIEKIGLELDTEMMSHGFNCDFLREADVCIEVARPAEAVTSYAWNVKIGLSRA